MHRNLKVGINGLGRIGKCVLLQLFQMDLGGNTNIEVKAINVTKLNIHDLQDYLNFDSQHCIRNKIQVNVLSPSMVQIGGNKINYIQERDNNKIDWKGMGVEYLIDCTGAFLTEEKCRGHNAPYTIISSPAKDKMPTFIFGVNEHEYNGETIVSGSSCTTNCLAPMIAHLDNYFGIEKCVFTTIHAATASQYVTDVIQKGARTDRSVFNNIIPHTTGASSSVTAVLPHLEGKIFGTSVRVPVPNCSLVDANIDLKQKDVSLDLILDSIQMSDLNDTVFSISKKKRVSSDFSTTTVPCIVDADASMSLKDGSFKFFLWYDNEWSYSAQLIRLVQSMHAKNTKDSETHFVENLQLRKKGVVCRFDFNVPLNKDGTIADTFRLDSTKETVQTILRKGAKYIVLVSHFGRPKDGYEEKYSMEFLIPYLSKLYEQEVKFLPHGVSKETLAALSSTSASGIFLLQNIRFHPEETLYEKSPESCASFLDIYSKLGDAFISDAFGCAHRKHLSVHSIASFGKPFGYGHLIKRELDALEPLVTLDLGKTILGIVGGNKVEDKLPIISTLKRIPGAEVYIAGGLASQYQSEKGDNNVFLMEDGFGSSNLYNMAPNYIENLKLKSEGTYAYDIGLRSLNTLLTKVETADIVFWNGSLGVIEHPIYRKGSEHLAMKLLTGSSNKRIIIGGGETASLFDKSNLPSQMYISTGGGALLEYLQNKVLHNKSLISLEIFGK